MVAAPAVAGSPDVPFDRLLCHAWLKCYSWRIDFTEGKYVFSGEAE
jgi:hypothetical protein